MEESKLFGSLLPSSPDFLPIIQTLREKYNLSKKKRIMCTHLAKIRFHDPRHTAASLMLNHGVPALVVSEIFGHANPTVTLSIYAHSTVDMQNLAVSVMDEIVTPIPLLQNDQLIKP